MEQKQEIREIWYGGKDEEVGEENGFYEISIYVYFKKYYTNIIVGGRFSEKKQSIHR